MNNGVTSLLSSLPNRPIAKFWVVTCYFNPLRYENRFKNFLTFARTLKGQHVNLLAVELAASDDDAHLSANLATKYVRVYADDVLWAKERLLNIALAHLPPECTQVCWCDCDLIFERRDWAAQCSRMLNSHAVVQPYRIGVFLLANETPENHGSRYTPLESFAAHYLRTGRKTLVNSPEVLASHPGYAWAARRDVLERCGRLYDRCILGHGDMVMALAFCHDAARDGPLPEAWDRHWDPGWSDALKADARSWQRRASEVVAGDVSFLQGRVFHLYHGLPKRRNYERRGQALKHFDPAKHIELHDSGTWKWTAEAKTARLDQAIQMYFKERREDE